MSKSNLQAVEDYADSQLNPIDVEFTNHFFDRLNDPRNIKPISAAELVGFFKRLSKNKKELISFLSKYKEIVAKDTQTNINIPLVNKINKIIAKTIMRKPDFQTSNPVLAFENLNEVEISGFSNDVNKAMYLIKDGSVDPNNKIKAFYPYEEVEYVPLLNSTKSGKPGTPFSIKGKIRYKDKGENLTSDVEVFIGFSTMGAGGYALIGRNQDDTFSEKAIILINAEYYNNENYAKVGGLTLQEIVSVCGGFDIMTFDENKIGCSWQGVDYKIGISFDRNYKFLWVYNQEGSLSNILK
jgi:hypothetical protein